MIILCSSSVTSNCRSDLGMRMSWALCRPLLVAMIFTVKAVSFGIYPIEKLFG